MKSWLLSSLLATTVISGAQANTLTLLPGERGRAPVAETRMAWQIPKSSAAPYVGPGDVIPNTDGLVWSLQAGTAAYAAANGRLFRLRRASDNAEQDFNSLITGRPDLPAIATFCGGDCFAAVIYEQTGNTYCGTSPSDFTCEWIQTTHAKQPKFIASCTNSLPCFQFDRSVPQTMVTPGVYGGGGPAVNLSWAVVARRIGNFTARQRIFATGPLNTKDGIYFHTTANQSYYLNNSVAPVVICAATDNVFHSMIAVGADPNSVCNVDGVDGVVGNAGNAGGVTGVTFRLGAYTAETNALDGEWTWLSMHNQQFDAGERASMRGALQVIWNLP